MILSIFCFLVLEMPPEAIDVLKKYEKAGGFTAHYTKRENQQGKVTYPGSTEQLDAFRLFEGDLKFKDAGHLRFDYKESNERGPVAQGFTIYNKSYRWTGRDQYNDRKKDEKPYVMYENVDQTNAHMFKDMEWRQFKIDGRSLTMMDLSSAVLIPFGGAKDVEIKYTGKGFEGGEAVAIFEVLETRGGPKPGEPEPQVRTFINSSPKMTQKSQHFISVNDGIPRKVVIFSGSHPYYTIQLKNVKAGQSFKDDDFKFEDKNKKYEAIDMSKGVSKNALDIKDAFDTPPEKTFEAFFETSVKEVKELRGSGFGMMGGAYYIRFKADKMPQLKPTKMTKVVTPNSKKVFEEFREGFPKDIGLEAKDEFELTQYERSSESGSEGMDFLINKTKGIYFFQYWYAS